jgi:hypothetical protein
LSGDRVDLIDRIDEGGIMTAAKQLKEMEEVVQALSPWQCKHGLVARHCQWCGPIRLDEAERLRGTQMKIILAKLKDLMGCVERLMEWEKAKG